VPDRFEVPQKLYGRELEVERLLRTFERVARGRAELMLVSGPSGVGKSALVHEIHKPVLARRGYFIAGKFDQLHRDKPCASLIVAFGRPHPPAPHRERGAPGDLAPAPARGGGDSGQALTEVMPEIELVIGPQPSVPALPLAQTQTRFHHVFQRFVRACAAEGHPLAIFLDDLQWADLPSLKLLESLLADPALKHLLIIARTATTRWARPTPCASPSRRWPGPAPRSPRWSWSRWARPRSSSSWPTPFTARWPGRRRWRG
jgi:predicted ATPase